MTETAPEPVALDAVVTVTEPAARQITSMLAEDNENAGKALRVFVEAGGCSGMQYGMVFDETRDDDIRSEFHGVAVVIELPQTYWSNLFEPSRNTPKRLRDVHLRYLQRVGNPNDTGVLRVSNRK